MVEFIRFRTQKKQAIEVHRDDVFRVIERDFPNNFGVVLKLLSGVSCSLIASERLCLAHLKLSGGSLEKLREILTISDSRDVVAGAEYPAYSRLASSEIDDMPAEEVQRIVDADRQQYVSWLNAE
ncbi:MAG: hypothetical protein ACE361_20550 [Aureliella sp.]